MVEGRLVGPRFTEGCWGVVEDGGADKTDLEHKVLLRCEDERGQRGGVTFAVRSKSSSQGFVHLEIV